MIIEKIAADNNTTPEEVRAEMEAAIHEAYLVGAPGFKAIFGDKEPSVEEFLVEAIRRTHR